MRGLGNRRPVYAIFTRLRDADYKKFIHRLNLDNTTRSKPRNSIQQISYLMASGIPFSIGGSTLLRTGIDVLAQLNVLFKSTLSTNNQQGAILSGKLCQMFRHVNDDPAQLNTDTYFIVQEDLLQSTRRHVIKAADLVSHTVSVTIIPNYAGAECVVLASLSPAP
jgi:hypothetical protein